MRTLTFTYFCFFWFASCAHLHSPLSPEEQSTICENFRKAALEMIHRHEDKSQLTVTVQKFEQTADDEALITYSVAYPKALDTGEKVNHRFHAEAKLKRDSAGIWQAVGLTPQTMELEFSNSLKVMRANSPASPSKKDR